MDKVLFLCVVYSTPPEKTSTIESLSRINFKDKNVEPTFSVWDNSTDGFETDKINLLFNNYVVDVMHTGRNESLSVIYNKIIYKYKEKCDWIVILDDDSVIDSDYIDCLKELINKSMIDSSIKIGIPKIYNNNVLISPGKVVGIRGVVLPNINHGVVNEKKIVAMMSGTVISIDKSTDFPKFDERLKFYGVDTKFFLDAENSNYKKYVFSYVMEHKSALRDTSLPVNEQFKRFDNLFKARKVIYENVPNYKIRLFIYKFLFSIKMTLLRKNLLFLKLILS
ncbi:hypothetical protein P2G42_17795 [Klebsiella electrica]|uniref:hypothetical protein n=1 Tax=Klebsiella electrica TaxID=1259973 RepID=UPI002556381D|nr:hypothetical protein [Klebsiella electrica]WIO41749.1 hypothetical protein P2G42_17795 [Klebsiella electrica]